MWRILITLIAFGVIYWIIKQALFPKKQRKQGLERKGETLVQDPVCKCYVPKSQAYAVDFKGKKLFFCSEDCHKKFLDPKYLPKD